jgi:succinate dehydrogenase/fumarate reductase cytochrome b subunit
MTLRALHRALAMGLGLFILLHLVNHLAGFAGQATHRQVQAALQVVYRSALIEPFLLAALSAQAGLGLTLLARRPRLTLQTLSGAYLALFLLIHVGAVLTARWQGVETDLAFAAAGLHARAPWPLVFALYYGLAVFAVFAHLSVPFGRRLPGLQPALPLVGAGVALGLVLLLFGAITPLVIPPERIAAFP